MIAPIISKYTTHDTKKRRITILSPLIWLLGFILSSSSSYFIFGNELWLKIFFVVLDLSVVIYFLHKYNFFAQNDPDRLHTEEYLLALKEIESMAIQGEAPKPILDAEILKSLPKQIENK